MDSLKEVLEEVRKGIKTKDTIIKQQEEIIQQLKELVGYLENQLKEKK